LTQNKEQIWKKRLGSIIELDYGHTVYEEVYFKNTRTNEKGYIDLYVVTCKNWEYQGLFPILGIECKVLDDAGMGWLIDSRSQMRKYMKKDNIFKREGQEFPPLSICLVATPESWQEGVVYKWNGTLSATKRRAQQCCWETMSFIFQRILLKEKCSILLNKKFQSNKEGPIKNYYLGE